MKIKNRLGMTIAEAEFNLVEGKWVNKLIAVKPGEIIPHNADFVALNEATSEVYYKVSTFIEYEDNSKEAEREDNSDQQTA